MTSFALDVQSSSVQEPGKNASLALFCQDRFPTVIYRPFAQTIELIQRAMYWQVCNKMIDIFILPGVGVDHIVHKRIRSGKAVVNGSNQVAVGDGPSFILFKNLSATLARASGIYTSGVNFAANSLKLLEYSISKINAFVIKQDRQDGLRRACIIDRLALQKRRDQ